MKKTLAQLALAIAITVTLVTGVAHADNPVPVTPSAPTYSDPCAAAGKNCYTVFSGFATALGNKFNQLQDADSLGAFINAIIALGIGAGGVLAVVMIMYEGFLYMKSDNVTTKGTARSRIVNTVIGFLLLLSIYTILRTINPQLLNLTPGIDASSLDPGQFNPSTDTVATNTSGVPTDAGTEGITCPGSGGASAIPEIVASMAGKITYRYGGSGTNTNFVGQDAGNACPTGQLCVDCAGFINYVYACAGLKPPDGGANILFSSADQANKYSASITSMSAAGPTVDNDPLTVGDILGWPNPDGHVIMYIGNGQTAEATSYYQTPNDGRQPGKGLVLRTDITHYQKHNPPLSNIYFLPQ